MVKEEDSRALAEAMLAIGRGMGKKVVALITDMEQPLGRTVGNALEIARVHRDAAGPGPGGPGDALRRAGGLDAEPGRGRADAWTRRARGCATRSASGAGLRKFQEVIALQGGDPRVCDDPSRLPAGARRRSSCAPRPAGASPASPAARSATAAMLLGAGRETVDSRIDPGVGFVLRKKVGDPVAAGEPLVTVHVNDRAPPGRSAGLLRRAIRIGPDAPAPRPLVHAVLQ